MLRKVALWCTLVAAVSFAAAYAVSKVSPWPSALVYRWLMDSGGEAMNAALSRHVPQGVASQLDLQYDGTGSDTRLDVYYPTSVQQTDRVLSTVVWIHGGGFLSGSKGQISNYLKILASKGYTAIGIDYSLAPAHRYPTPVRQANSALAFLQQNARHLHIDTGRLFLAGDSAGAQIAAQLAAAISMPEYAESVGVNPSISREQLKGVILHCGLFDPHSLESKGAFAGFVQTTVWSYLGSKDIKSAPEVDRFSIIRNVSKDMPPLFISAGNADPLAIHSKRLAETALRLGVPVESVFFPDDYQPPLQHEYQFNLDTDAGRLVLQRTLEFVSEWSR